MKDRNLKYLKILVTLSAFICALLFGCSNDEESGSDNNISEVPQVIKENTEDVKNGNGEEIAIKPPPFSDGIFPCNECHIDIEPNPVRRELIDMHDDITAMFDHDSENRWCLDCHDINSRDSLRLASGKLVGFDESYKLCGQCHGDKLRDWKVGVHGKRTGDWNGKKQYLLCAHCHNPHSPKFESLKPLPPPTRQEDIHL